MLALALTVALAAAPATALAAGSGESGPASGVCPKMPVAGVVGGKVSAGINIDDVSSTAVRRLRCGEARRVVRTLVRRRAEMPQRVRGFRCTPTLRGRKISWECVYRGGEPRTAVTFDFAYRLKRAE